MSKSEIPDLMGLARLVARMLHAQKDAKRTNATGAIEDAKRLEEKVEDTLLKIFNQRQKSLFPD